MIKFYYTAVLLLAPMALCASNTINLDAPALYAPGQVNTPLLTKAKSFSPGIYNSFVNGFDFSAAYMVTDNIGISASFLTSPMGKESSSKNGEKLTIDNKDCGVEAAVGYSVTPFSNVVTNVYGGYGFAYANSVSFLGRDPAEADAFLHTVFVRPAVGLVYKHFETALIAKASVITTQNYNDRSNKDTGNKSACYFEPGIIIRMGFENVKFHAGLGFMILHYGDSLHNMLPIDFTTGVTGRF